VSTPYNPNDPADQQQPATPGAYPPGPYPQQGAGTPYPPQPRHGQQDYLPPGGYAPAGYLQGDPVGFGTAISEAFRNMFNYRGRASLSAFWWFYLFAALVGGGIGMIAIIATGPSHPSVLFLVIFVPLLLVVLPLIVRRLHDQDKSGFWFFVDFVPFIGVIWLLVLMLREGTPRPNRFG
jgi:uncharacterized membrane protein YhaH (DUF805 family)